MRRPSPTSAKRWAIKLALCLLAGAVVTWGVVVGLSLWDRPRKVTDSKFCRDDGSLWGRMDLGIGCEGVSIYDVDRRRVSIVPSWGDRFPRKEPPRWFDLCEAGRREALGGRTDSYEVVAFGWPLPSLAKTTNRSWVIPKQLSLPTELLPLGFALNTLFYAAVLLGMVECIAFARRRLRHRKGRCPSCGYDRAGLAEGAACPECGGRA